MHLEDKSEEIARHLLMGRLVISGRCTGKTRAIAKVLYTNDKAVAIVSNIAQRQALIRYLLAYGITENDASKKVYLSSTVKDKKSYFTDKDVFVDELALSSYHGPYFAAVSSFPHEVVVIK